MTSQIGESNGFGMGWMGKCGDTVIGGMCVERGYDSDRRIIIDGNTDEAIVNLYFTYEFSDRIVCLFKDNPACATIWGFMESEKLSVQEAVDALFG